MSRLPGLAITGVAIYLAINSLPDIDTRDQHVAAVAIATDNREGMARDFIHDVSTGRSFSPSNPMVAQVETSPVDPLPPVAAPALKPPFPVPAPVRVTASGESMKLAATDAAQDVQPVLMKAVMANPPKPKNVLIETQRELKRVGCYRGRIDGIWGKRSKRAFRTFVKRTTTLSRAARRDLGDQPEANVLDALRKTSRRICGRPCASGKMLSSGGRCVNDPVIMASLSKPNNWKPVIRPADSPGADRADRKAERRTAEASKAEAEALKRKLKRKRVRLAKKRWRNDRYALGGPKYHRKKRARSRYIKRYRYRARQRDAWIREALGDY